MPQEIKNTLDFSNEGFIVNIPDGVNDQDAVNVRQLNSAILNGISGASGKYLISGGAVWSGTGLTYNTSYISFFWNGNKLASPTSLTLATSDPTNNRLDAIVVDESETVSVIAGVASASPITPAIPEDQLLVQFILVEAGTTVPAITQENIYLDNAEWTFANYTTSGSQVGTSNPNATNSPKEGTKCIDNSLGPLSGIRFSRATSLDLTPFTTFAMWIRIPASIDSKETLIARFENTSFAPTGNQVDLFSFGIQKTILGTWQLAIVPVSAFGVTTVKGFRLIMTGGKSNVQVLWDADFITLTNGSTPVTISPNINFYKNSTIVGSQKGLDLLEGVGMGITAVIDPLKATVKYTLTPDTNKAYVDAADAVLQTNINAKENTITAGTSSQYWRGDKTWQNLEPAVLATGLSGLSITGGSIASTDNVLQSFGKLQNQINGLLGGATYEGVWNATTNSPALASGVGTKGYYYVVSVDGATNLDGITDWKIGDWAIFNGTTWNKVDNTDAVSSVNGAIGAISLAGTANRLTVSGTTFDIASTYAGQSSITTVGTIATGVWNGTAIGLGYGGTGFSTYAAGDLIYASAVNTLAKLAAGTNGYVLTLASGLPTWAAASGGSGIYAGTGTAFTSYATGDLIYASASNTLSKLSAGNEGYALTLSNGLPTWMIPDGGTVYSITRTVSSNYSNAVDIGSFTLSGGTSNFDIWISVPAIHMSKRYVFPCILNGTGNTWQIIPADKTTGAWNGNDFAIDINVNNSVVSLRIRSIWPVNNTPGTAYITIKRHGVDTDTFTPSSTEAAATTPTVIYSIATDQSVLGIFTATSGTVSGNLFANTLRVAGSAGTQSNYSLSSWNTSGRAVPGFFQVQQINGASTLNAEEPAIVLGRKGTTGAYDNFIEFNVSRYSTSGNASHSRLGISGIESGNNEFIGTKIICFQSDGKVGIGVGSAVPNTSCLLEILSTTKGFLPPRMTTTQVTAITSPAEALQAYDLTVHGLKVNNGTVWNNIVHSDVANAKVTTSAPYTNDGYIIVTIGGVNYKLMTTA